MDMPNLALAKYLAEQDQEVHLVTHRAEMSLASRPNVTIHHVPKPANSYLLAAPVLDRIGRHWAAQIAARKGRVLVNGGNCCWGDVNWVHYVHAAYPPPRIGTPLRLIKNQSAHAIFLAYERAALKRARVVITNSERTKRDVIEHLKIDPTRVHTIYYGIDNERFRPSSDSERARARASLGWAGDNPIVAFIGALGDRRKGLDKVFVAWQQLCMDSQWDADLVVVGAGVELAHWRARVAEAGLSSRINFIGFRDDVPTILAACDALVSPTRYEAYGQGVHEALCCGLPAIVTQTAGVAEQYPSQLQELLLSDPENVGLLIDCLKGWRRRAGEYRVKVISLSERLRVHTWKQMAIQFLKVVDIAA